jgi:hypothetical protein
VTRDKAIGLIASFIAGLIAAVCLTIAGAPFWGALGVGYLVFLIVRD